MPACLVASTLLAPCVVTDVQRKAAALGLAALGLENASGYHRMRPAKSSTIMAYKARNQGHESAVAEISPTFVASMLNCNMAPSTPEARFQFRSSRKPESAATHVKHTWRCLCLHGVQVWRCQRDFAVPCQCMFLDGACCNAELTFRKLRRSCSKVLRI